MGEDIGYNVYAQEMNTLEHGLPQQRRRLFIVGILRSVDKGTFAFPAPIKWSPRLDDVLGKPNAASDTPSRRLLPKTLLARRNVLHAFKKMKTKGQDPLTTQVVVDTGCSADFATYRANAFPCITASRGGGLAYWLSPVGRKVTANELLRAQGYKPEELHVSGISAGQLGKLAGNGISLCCLERLLPQALSSAGLRDNLVDPWAKRSPRAQGRSCTSAAGH